jgi:peroxiredoxin
MSIAALLGLAACAASAGSPPPLPTAIHASFQEEPASNGASDSPSAGDEQRTGQEDALLLDPNISEAAVEEPRESVSSASPQITSPDSPESGTDEDPADLPASEGPLPEVGVEVGYLAPDFTLQALDGSELSLADLRGHPVLLNYWATWCPPCLEELGYFETLQHEFEDRGFRIVAVNGIEQDVLDDVRATVSEAGISYPVLLDHDEEVWKTFQVQFMPTTFYIDARGIIRGIQLGSAGEGDFRANVLKLLE